MTVAVIAMVVAMGGCSRGTIWQAAQRNDIVTTKLIVQWHPERIEWQDEENGWTPLQWSIAHSNGETFGALLSRGADPTARSRDGRTPRQFAEQVSNEIIRKFFLDRLDRAIVQFEAQQPIEFAKTDDQAVADANPQ